MFFKIEVLIFRFSTLYGFYRNLFYLGPTEISQITSVFVCVGVCVCFAHKVLINFYFLIHIL